jgi:hypothetical protein
MLRILHFSSSLICSILFATSLANQITTPAAAAAPQEVTALDPGKTIEQEISGKAEHKYRIALKPGEYAGVIVEQHGIDVAVYILDGNGKVIADFDSESRIEGKERVGLIAESGADYSLSVRPKYSRASAGHYAIRIAEIRPAAEQDRWLLEAHKLSAEVMQTRLR